jgi:hypothetical protein
MDSLAVVADLQEASSVRPGGIDVKPNNNELSIDETTALITRNGLRVTTGRVNSTRLSALVVVGFQHRRTPLTRP